MAKLVAKIVVKSIERKCTSSYGNPSYWIEFDTKDYRLNRIGVRRGHTGSNAQCGYYCSSSLEGKECWIEYHFTKKGTLIIDTMEEEV